MMTKITDNILSVVSFEHQCVIMKGALQSEQLDKYMITIRTNQ